MRSHPLLTRPWKVVLPALFLAATHALSAAVLPPLEARRQELAALSKEVKDLEPTVGPKANAAIGLIPEFSRHLKDLHKVPLDETERKALLAQGISGLSAEKASKFEAAAPTFQAMKEILRNYFAAYDRYQGAEIRLRTFGAVLGAHESYDALRPLLKEKHQQKFDKLFEELSGHESNYRDLLAKPDSKHHHIHYASKDTYFGAVDLSEEMLKFERKHGLKPKLRFSERVGKFFKGLRHKARQIKIHALALPGAARLFTHVFLRPFWNKSHDAAKTNDLIRFYSKNYRWAAGMNLNVRGQEGIPQDAPVVFALSHRATFEDAMTMTAVVPGTYSFMWGAWAMPEWLKKKLVADPTIIAVGGTKEDGTKVNAITDSVQAIREGRNLAVFPEGNVPTPQKETRPLRSGIDVITQEVSEKPVYIVPISIDGTAPGWDSDTANLSHKGKMSVDVTIGQAIDPLRLKSVPGADQELLLNTIRGIYHRNLYRADVPLAPPSCEESCSQENLGVIPPDQGTKFEALHQAP